MKKDDKKIWLFALVLVVIVLVLLVSIFKNRADSKNLWNSYNDFSYADVFLNATRVEDRTIYWSLNDIVAAFVSSYYEEGVTYDLESDVEVTYEDYYQALSEDYKIFLGKDGYLDLAKTFLRKFMIENDEEEAIMEYEGLIDAVYLVEENVYLCNLSSKIKNTSAYIIIGLNPDEKSFQIMYME